MSNRFEFYKTNSEELEFVRAKLYKIDAEYAIREEPDYLYFKSPASKTVTEAARKQKSQQ